MPGLTPHVLNRFLAFPNRSYDESFRYTNILTSRDSIRNNLGMGHSSYWEVLEICLAHVG